MLLRVFIIGKPKKLKLRYDFRPCWGYSVKQSAHRDVVLLRVGCTTDGFCVKVKGSERCTRDVCAQCARIVPSALLVLVFVSDSEGFACKKHS